MSFLFPTFSELAMALKNPENNELNILQLWVSNFMIQKRLKGIDNMIKMCVHLYL